jgi:hypothetical protein
MLSRSNFLAYKDLPREEVQVPALGGSVFVRTLSAGEWDQFETVNVKVKGKDFRARIVVATACDESGVDIFRVEDLAPLSKLAKTALDPIVEAALRINALTEKANEDGEKNSGSAPTTASVGG